MALHFMIIFAHWNLVNDIKKVCEATKLFPIIEFLKL